MHPSNNLTMALTFKYISRSSRKKMLKPSKKCSKVWSLIALQETCELRMIISKTSRVLHRARVQKKESVARVMSVDWVIDSKYLIKMTRVGTRLRWARMTCQCDRREILARLSPSFLWGVTVLRIVHHQLCNLPELVLREGPMVIDYVRSNSEWSHSLLKVPSIPKV
jgi:hypothetical protein